MPARNELPRVQRAGGMSFRADGARKRASKGGGRRLVPADAKGEEGKGTTTRHARGVHTEDGNPQATRQRQTKSRGRGGSTPPTRNTRAERATGGSRNGRAVGPAATPGGRGGRTDRLLPAAKQEGASPMEERGGGRGEEHETRRGGAQDRHKGGPPARKPQRGAKRARRGGHAAGEALPGREARGRRLARSRWPKPPLVNRSPHPSIPRPIPGEEGMAGRERRTKCAGG